MQMRRWRKILLVLCPLFASLCLAAGLLPAGGWAEAWSLGALLAWAVAYRWRDDLSANLALVAATLAAVVGLSLGAAPVLMILSATLSLASWDLLRFDHRLRDNPPTPGAQRLETLHARYLALALGTGLLLALLGRLVHFQIPFVIMLLFVALAYFALDRLLRVFLR